MINATQTSMLTCSWKRVNMQGGKRNPWATREGTVEERKHGRLRPSQPSVKPERSRLCASLLQLLDEGCQSRAEAVSTQQGAPPQPEQRRDATPPPMISSFTFCSSFRTSSRISCRADGKQPSGVSSPHACLRPPKVCGSTPQRQALAV